MRDHNTRLTFAHQVEGKSTTKELYSAYLVNAVLQDLRYLDYNKLIHKTRRTQ